MGTETDSGDPRFSILLAIFTYQMGVTLGRVWTTGLDVLENYFVH